MTSTYNTIYRITELMLQYENHILSVDQLFEDEKIGDYVKSIQIDSPYQQLLLEGVLTESIQEGKLFVSFTVEGYFHFVLGEILLDNYSDLGIKQFQKDIENSEFIHFSSGVSQMLVQMVQNEKYEFLIYALNNQLNYEIITPSVIQTLLIGKKTEFIYQVDDPIFWIKILNVLLLKANYKLVHDVLIHLPSSISSKIISYAFARHLPNDVLKKLYDESNISENNFILDFFLGNFDKVLKEFQKSKNHHTEDEWICIISTLIDTGDFDESLRILDSIIFDDNFKIEKLRLLAIAYNGSNSPEYAKSSIDSAISESLIRYGSYHFKSAELFNIKGLLSLANEDYNAAQNSLYQALNIFEKSKGKSNFEFISTTGNLALVAYHSGSKTRAIRIWLEVIDMLKEIGMGQHPETALVLKNLAFTCYEENDLKHAKKFSEQAINILKNHQLMQTSSFLDCKGLLKKLKGV